MSTSHIYSIWNHCFKNATVISAVKQWHLRSRMDAWQHIWGNAITHFSGAFPSPLSDTQTNLVRQSFSTSFLQIPSGVFLTVTPYSLKGIIQPNVTSSSHSIFQSVDGRRSETVFYCSLAASGPAADKAAPSIWPCDAVVSQTAPKCAMWSRRLKNRICVSPTLHRYIESFFLSGY